ncbi:hypothetical protein [Bifidobacterium panos]|uniref:Transcriptional regulator n=1 Tax=Bifidobacterium panos TaxID=2675321 RepID=A0ABX1SYB6_9BIFI|nr:hypothetical protein [Bifidobacterium sp. DSM 109963]NMN02820.1 hypothetical protein [Bifidobacterium sp. DSM 109963]
MSGEIKDGAVELGSVVVREEPENNFRALCKVHTKALASIQLTKRGTLTLSLSRSYLELTADEATQLADLLLDTVCDIRQNTSEEGAER